MSDKTERYKNKVALIGDIQFKTLRKTAKGKYVLNLRVSTRNSRKNYTKIMVTFWDKQAEDLNTQIETVMPTVEDSERIEGGLLIKLTGELQQSDWEDKKGNKRTTISILGKQFKLLEG